MSYKALKETTKIVLQYIKDNPGANVNSITAAMDNISKPEVSAALYSLWVGRYVTRNQGVTKSEMGLSLLDYWWKTDKPRGHRRAKGNGATHPSDSAPVEVVQTVEDTARAEVELLIALKDSASNKTFTITFAQARSLMQQLKTLVV